SSYRPRQDIFSRAAGTRYRSNSLPLFQKHPGAASLPWEIGRNDDQGLSAHHTGLAEMVIKAHTRLSYYLRI
ncbi:MAG: hypothetical protein V2B19_22440, partial [Pseudomonadota bacterium]